MVQNRTVLTPKIAASWKTFGFSTKCVWFIFILTLVWGAVYSQDSIVRSNSKGPIHLVIGGTWTRHIIAGGWGASLGCRINRLEVNFGGESNPDIWGIILGGRWEVRKGLRKTVPIIGARASYYYSRSHLGSSPGYMLNVNASIGVKQYITSRFSIQGQLGFGYGSYFRQNGEPFFTPTWLPTRMLHVGVGYDLPLRRIDAARVLPEQPQAVQNGGKLSFLLHTGLQINYLAPPSFERFTVGLGYDVHPKLALTLRHQAVSTSDGMKYGKSLAGVRWMPGNGTRLRWVGSLEAGHWGSALNFQGPFGAFGVMAGQHLQYPLARWAAIDLGLQYALLKAPRPLQPASSDFETSIGLVFRPWARRTDH